VTNRAILEYEELSGDKNMDFGSTRNMLRFFYCIAKAGARDERKKFDYSYEEFLNIIDDYYAETLSSIAGVLNEEQDPTDEVKKKLMETLSL